MTSNRSMSVDPSGTVLLRGGDPFFYTADTPWYGFMRPTDEEWDYYLRYRAEQGFNVLHLSLMPIVHEISEPDPWSPFGWNADGTPDVSTVDRDYFAHAAARVRRAQEHGFTCAVALLWANYVPDTWAALRDERFVLAPEVADEVVRLAVEALAPYDPIFFISGDTNFPSARALELFVTTLTTVSSMAPACLTAFHTQPQALLPDELASSPDLDLYVYQSGHTVGQHEALVVGDAEHYAAAPVRRPVIDVEPCYERHGYGRAYGRFTAHDIRRASWTAVLAGASAGIGYGAHGIFQWYRAGEPFAGEAFSSTPYDWREVLHAEGAFDVAALRDFVDTHALHGLVARQDLLSGAPEGVRAAATADGSRVVVYAPWPAALRLAVPEPESWRVQQWTLEDRRTRFPRTRHSDGALGVEMPAATGDSVLLLTR
jgi:hypothetical protein